MEKFVSSTSPANSSLWDAYREKIALDLGRELSGDEHEIENMLADVDSFMKKGSLVKSSRRFSWSQLCCEQLHEFHVLKMLLADHRSVKMSLSALAQGKNSACIPIRRIHNRARSSSKAECQSLTMMVSDRKMHWVLCKSCHRLVVQQIHGKN